MRLILFSLLLCLSAYVESAMPGEYGDVLVSRINSVYDGDTFKCDVDAWPDMLGKNIPIRIKGIDTPEIRTRNPKEKMFGKRARAFADSLLTGAKVVILRRIERPKYFRVLADVEIDGKDMADIMLDRGFAVRYYGGKKHKWRFDD